MHLSRSYFLGYRDFSDPILRILEQGWILFPSVKAAFPAMSIKKEERERRDRRKRVNVLPPPNEHRSCLTDSIIEKEMESVFYGSKSRNTHPDPFLPFSANSISNPEISRSRVSIKAKGSTSCVSRRLQGDRQTQGGFVFVLA